MGSCWSKDILKICRVNKSGDLMCSMMNVHCKIPKGRFQVLSPPKRKGKNVKRWIC